MILCISIVVFIFQYKERRILLEKEQLEKQVGLLNAQLSERNKEFISFRRDKVCCLYLGYFSK